MLSVKIINEKLNLLSEIVNEQHECFAMIYRPKYDDINLEILVGIENFLETTDDIEELIKNTKINKKHLLVIPYRQIREKGFEVKDDNSRLVSIEVCKQEKHLLSEVMASLPCEGVKTSHCSFVDSDDEYEEVVNKIIRDEIGSGQGANFVIKRTFNGHIDNFSIRKIFSIFKKLIAKESGSYWTFLIKTKSCILIGASPEQHISLINNRVSMMPISGTYKYPASGPTPKGLLDFLNDKKEENELYMVLDEELKMMTKICSENILVSGPQLFPMSKLLHTGYIISGQNSSTISNLIKSSLFAPTVTGSPLENASRVIAKYESTPRSYYSGCAFLLENDDITNIDSCILIRTLEIDYTGKFALSVGATIVRDSVSSEELKETKIKVAALQGSLGLSVDNDLFSNSTVNQVLLNKNNNIGRFWLTPKLGSNGNKNLSKYNIVIIDNEDEFTSMTKYLLKSMGFNVRIINYLDINDIKHDEIIFVGPGPGDPRDIRDKRVIASNQVIQMAIDKKRYFFAVCFGHQILSQFLGLKIERLANPNQGVQRNISFFGKKEKVGFYNTFTAIYKPLKNNKIDGLEIAYDDISGEVFGLRGKHFASMQFHPESVISIDGERIVWELINSVMKLCT